jgi:hypothetical protein
METLRSVLRLSRGEHKVRRNQLAAKSREFLNPSTVPRDAQSAKRSVVSRSDGRAELACGFDDP